MSDKTLKPANRRDVLKGILRNTVLAGFGATVIGMGVKRAGTSKEAACSNRGICSGCSEYADCVLPQALSRKQALSE